MITWLAEQHRISRTFLYTLLSSFKEALSHQFSPIEKLNALSKEEIEARILSYRFEGGSSIDAISTLLKRDGLPYSSVGSVSQILTHLGKSLLNTLESKAESLSLVFADDEIFAKSSPILITVDPVSSAILKIEWVDNRSADKWVDHLNGLVGNGFSPRLLASDAGTALKSAHERVFSDIPWQLDTFHGISHRLGDWERRLEKSANAHIEATEKRRKTRLSAKTDRVIIQRQTLCDEAEVKENQAIDLYEGFSYLYHYIIHQLTLFNTEGKLRNRDEVEENMAIALELMTSLGHQRISKEARLITKTLPELLTYFKEAPDALDACQKLTDNKDALQSLILAWQWDKAVIKAKVTTRKHRAIKERDSYLELAELLIGNKEQTLELKASITAELDQIIQASSIVECINSILRPYLNNSRNQVTQEFLNTFMFYHNHRRYHAGKRKGKTPMELLMGKEQKEDWIVLLQRKVKERILSA